MGFWGCVAPEYGLQPARVEAPAVTSAQHFVYSSHWQKFLCQAAEQLSLLLNFTSNNPSISENKKKKSILIVTALSLRVCNNSDLWNKVVMLVCRRGKVSPILVSQNHFPQMQPGSKP